MKLAIDILDMARENIINSATARDSNELDISQQDNFQSFTTSLIIAYYNMGIELEYTKQYNEALKSFTKGHQLALKELDANHPLTQNLYRNMMVLLNKNQVLIFQLIT